MTCGERFGTTSDSLRHVRDNENHKLTVKFLDSWTLGKEGDQHDG